MNQFECKVEGCFRFYTILDQSKRYKKSAVHLFNRNGIHYQLTRIEREVTKIREKFANNAFVVAILFQSFSALTNFSCN